MPLTLDKVLVLFVVLFAVFRALEWLRPRHKRTPLLRRGVTTDLSYWALGPTVIDTVIGFVVLIAMVDGVEPPQPPAVEAAMGPIANKIGNHEYHHRLHHKRQLAQRSKPAQDFCPFDLAVKHQRAQAHSATTLDWLSVVRSHPVNELVGRVALLVPLLFLGFRPEAVMGLAPVIGLFALLVHANLDWDWGPFRTVLVSPVFHRWHHTSPAEGGNKNFAPLFPVWDILFGTYYMPKGRVPERFGSDTPVPEGIFRQLAFPFRRDDRGKTELPAKTRPADQAP